MGLHTDAFIDRLSSAPSVVYLPPDIFDRATAVRVMCFSGPSGKRIRIDVSEEEIPTRTCRDYLRELGLDTQTANNIIGIP
jgi:hypothetical protein